MELFNNLIFGFGVAFSLQNLLYCFIGCFLGTLIGILPGIGPLATDLGGRAGTVQMGDAVTAAL